MPALRYTPREQQQQHIADWRDSGLSRKQYAQLHHLNPKTLARWIANESRLTPDKSPVSSFIPAIVTSAPLSTTAMVTLNLARCSITCRTDQLAAIMAELKLC
ncbi:IS66 family insertion sequence element accessory protein TnpA [Xenorhabdus miraniensis]|uniref:Transposase n=1 Tax=Xenorhabdus miraniensis TaxID=351674 RepID=A0A2D0JJG9_9GAMM|nr:hypothetical protein [Xenorhabdus miraniensis]PHM45574.1 hypothetical protein Xmir_04253 [Xenorhabdus miraniensis]